MTHKTITIENLGPVKHATIPIPEGGGVVVLSGRNGVGKSETLEAVDKLVGRQADIAAPTDGHERGVVEGLGVRLTVGRSTRRTGELEVTALEAKLSVADIVDPGIIDPAAADEKRMKAILSILQVKPEKADWMGLADELAHEAECDTFDATIKAELEKASDVLILAARLKASLSRFAATEEEAARGLKAAIGVLCADPRVASHEDPLPPPPIEQLSEAMHKAMKREQALQARVEQSAQLAEWKSEIEKIGTCKAEVEQGEKDVDEASQRVDELREQLEEAEAELVAARGRLDFACEQATRYNSLASKISGATPPDQAEVEEATEAVRAAVEALNSSEETKRVIAARKQVNQATQELVSRELRAKALRKVSQRPEAILGQMVASKVDGIRFDSGRLIVTHPKRGDIPFAELSTGERWRFAIQVAVCGVGEGGLLVIPQDAWQDLDPPNRKQIAKLAAAEGVVIITAECSDDRVLTPSIV